MYNSSLSVSRPVFVNWRADAEISSQPILSLSLYSVRSALIGSTLAARPAGTALAASATTATSTTASR